MIVPAIGGIPGIGGLTLSAGEAALPASPASPSASAAASHTGSVGETQGVEAPAGAEGLQAGATQGVEGTASGGSSSSFGNALTQAISSLEGSQRSADGAAQALATGTVKDPESAVVTVEDAAMSMQLAAQIRAKATEAAQTIFQTQV